jgi:hypothetical protein
MALIGRIRATISEGITRKTSDTTKVEIFNPKIQRISIFTGATDT